MSSLNKNQNKRGTEPLSILGIYNKELPPIDYVFKAFKSGTIGFLSSAGGTGKSMFALHLAFSLSDSTKTYNFKPIIDTNYERGIICYLNLEDPREILEYRIKKLLIKYLWIIKKIN